MGMGRQHKQSILLIYRAEGLFIKKRRKKKKHCQDCHLRLKNFAMKTHWHEQKAK